MAVEIDAMQAFGECREHPAQPSEADASATLAEIATFFGGESRIGCLPTTVMHFYKRLGLWDLATRILERLDPDRGEIERHSTSDIWRFLGYLLKIYPDLADLQKSLQMHALSDSEFFRQKQ